MAVRVLALSVLALTGCMSVSQPRLGVSLEDEKFGTQDGAAADSRTSKLAFVASPAEEPQTIDVDTGLGGTRVQVAQWLTDTALAMNKAIGKYGLFDERAAPVTRLVFHSKTDAGEIQYDWDPRQAPLPEVAAHLARLKVVKLTARSTSEGVQTLLVVEATLPEIGRAHV